MSMAPAMQRKLPRILSTCFQWQSRTRTLKILRI
ncbi:hypothetical protein FRIGORI9N_470035 [Frigoribacterium sp. 9N]|nr:hypothetical protein FRIGORI9N_470035 [Frigoribacterium sp. 9N]